MDSMYGPMSWLRLHAAGKQVIGLTSAARTQTDYRIERPINAGRMTLQCWTRSPVAARSPRRRSPKRRQSPCPRA
jgi:hypothetical protein